MIPKKLRILSFRENNLPALTFHVAGPRNRPEPRKVSMSDSDSVEDIARDLMQKIRNSKFLEENPPRGESIFKYDVELETSKFDSEVEDPTQSNEETVEDIARKIMMQLRTSGISAPTDQSLASKASIIGQDDGLCRELEDMLTENIRFDFQTVSGMDPSRNPAVLNTCNDMTNIHPEISLPKLTAQNPNSGGKPRFHDAVDFLLGELDRPSKHEPSDCAVIGLEGVTLHGEDDSADDELLEAFRAMAGTVDAFVLDYSGRLEAENIEDVSDVKESIITG